MTQDLAEEPTEDLAEDLTEDLTDCWSDIGMRSNGGCRSNGLLKQQPRPAQGP